MPDPGDYKLDLSTTPKAPATPTTPREEANGSSSRPYVGVHFACCGVYLRIYRSADEKHYRGRCPKCGVPVNFVVGEGGTAARTFVVR
jgi:hypothetical protein